MPRLRVRSEAGIDLEDLDLDDLAGAAPISTAADRFVLAPESGVQVVFEGAFAYADGAAAPPTSGTLSRLRLIEDGEVEADLSGLSVDLGTLLSAMRADAEDEAGGAALEALREQFDVDPLSDGALISAAPDAFRVAWGGEVARFEGGFAYADGTGALPTSGTVSAFVFSEDGTELRRLDGLSLDVAELRAALGPEDGWDAADADAAADAAEAEAEALLEAFGIDPFQDGGALASAGPDAFEVAWGAETARFEGGFGYAGGEGGWPASGTIESFVFSEQGEVARRLDGLSVPLDSLLGAMDLLTADWGSEAPAGDDGEADADPVFSLLDGLLSGDDRLRGSAADDALSGRGGRDRLIGRDGRDDLDGGAGGDRLKGGGGDDRLDGGAGRDRLKGGGGDDRLDGGAGRDRLKGGGGEDVLLGGGGRDVLVGGAGADVFDFDHAADSGRGRSKDRLRDFEQGVDLIDLSDIDADPFSAGDQAFSLISGRFTGAAGELALRGNKLRADLDGDGRADMVIRLNGADQLEADDFIL